MLIFQASLSFIYILCTIIPVSKFFMGIFCCLLFLLVLAIGSYFLNSLKNVFVWLIWNLSWKYLPSKKICVFQEAQTARSHLNPSSRLGVACHPADTNWGYRSVLGLVCFWEWWVSGISADCGECFLYGPLPCAFPSICAPCPGNSATQEFKPARMRKCPQDKSDCPARFIYVSVSPSVVFSETLLSV